MIDNNSINEILGIKESYELPDRLMELLLDNNTDELFDRFKSLESDLSYDWFTDYFQEQHSNRDSMMQDFTPRELCRLLPMLADEYDSVADVCCGTGGLTIAAWNKNPQALFYCEELSTRAFPLLLFNLAIRNITAVAVNKDVLKNEIYGIYKVEGGRVMKLDEMPEIGRVDIVITNPPYSVKWKYNEKDRDIRFMEYGYPPTQFADYGFILHALSLLKDNGRIYAILPHGILFRGNREEQIREKLINNRMWISVIGLPDKLFKNTSIPVCVCVFGANKNNGILFVDASREYEKQGKYNRLNDEHLDKISMVFRSMLEVDRYSHIAGYSELADNGYNLNIPRYVDTYEAPPVPDLMEVMEDMAELEREILETKLGLIEMMKQLTSDDPETVTELEQGIKLWEEAVNERVDEESNGQLRFVI